MGPEWPATRRRRRRLDGKPAAPSTVSRKRAILFNAPEYAVERGHLAGDPLTSIKWRAPKLDEAVYLRAEALALPVSGWGEL